MKAINKKATPAQNPLPVSNQTTMAIMAAGRKKRTTLAITTIMMMPMTKRISNMNTSNNNGKPREETSGSIVEPFFKADFLEKHSI